MRERDLEQKLVRLVREKGGWAIKLSAQWDAGMPDRLICFPGGKVLFVEMKAPGQNPRPIQIRIHEKLRRLGFTVLVIDSEAKIHDMLSEQI